MLSEKRQRQAYLRDRDGRCRCATFVRGIEVMRTEEQKALRGGELSRVEALQMFGELDVHRAERRGLEFYVDRTASPKVHYLAFASALLQCWVRWKMEGPVGVGHWLPSLPEHLRGALFWWMRFPHFSQMVLKRQKAKGHWPFDEKVS